MRKTTAKGNDPAPGAPIPVHFNPQETVTMAHVQALTNIVTTMGDTVYSLRGRDGADDLPREGPGSEIYLAAEATLIRACAKLDAIIEDDQRWGTERHQELERRLNAQLKAQENWLKAQSKHLTNSQLPHVQYAPNLARIRDARGSWVAYVGELSSPSCVMGSGHSPRQALAAFDDVFEDGDAIKSVEQFCKEQGISLDQQPEQDAPPPQPPTDENQP